MKVAASEDLKSFFAKKLSVLKGPTKPPPSPEDDDLDVIQELPIIRREVKETKPKKAAKPFKTFFSESKEREDKIKKEQKEKEKQLDKERKEREKQEKKEERERLRLLKKEERKEEKSEITGQEKPKRKKKKDSFQSFFDEQLNEAVKDLVLGAVKEEADKKFNEMYFRRRKAILGY